jgi:hypothetical protein
MFRKAGGQVAGSNVPICTEPTQEGRAGAAPGQMAGPGTYRNASPNELANEFATDFSRSKAVLVSPGRAQLAPSP